MRQATAICALALLVSCEQSGARNKAQDDPNAALITIARTAMMERLKDPESVRFRNVTLLRRAAKDILIEGSDTGRGERVAFCGELNGRTPMGGYSGYNPFLVVLNESSTTAEEVRIAHPDGDTSDAAYAVIVKMKCDSKGSKEAVRFADGPYAGGSPST